MVIAVLLFVLVAYGGYCWLRSKALDALTLGWEDSQ